MDDDTDEEQFEEHYPEGIGQDAIEVSLQMLQHIPQYTARGGIVKWSAVRGNKMRGVAGLEGGIHHAGGPGGL
jgi:hypothetical protein